MSEMSQCKILDSSKPKLAPCHPSTLQESYEAETAETAGTSRLVRCEHVLHD